MLRITSCLILFFSIFGCVGEDTPSQEEVESRVRDILSLPTFEHIYRDVVYVGEEAKFLNIITKDIEALFSIDVHVQAGIDLTEGMDIRFLDKDSAVVSLPRAKILHIDADENTIHQYFVREFGGSISTLQYYDEINAKKKLLEEDAISRGILIRAEENAALLIQNILGLAGYTDIEMKRMNLPEPAADEEAEQDG